MNTYELVVMYSPNIKEADLKGYTEDLQKKAKELGGSLEVTEDWGLKKLAYRIGKFEQAYYHIYKLVIESTKANSLITYINNKDGIIRNLLSVVDRED